MKHRNLLRLLSCLLVLAAVVGLMPAVLAGATETTTLSTGTPGESTQNPILISTMDQLIAELEKDTEGATYYRLTEDVSHETSIEYFDGREDHTGDDGYTTVRKPQMAQCVVGTGKKFLELDGYDIHYKNNVNFNLGDDNSKFLDSGSKHDSLTFFYLGEGCDLTVTNSTGDDAEVWYDGWMHNRTNFFGGPNYIYTAVRDVFRVDAGAELTVNNTDIKAGRNRKVWMVHSFYLDKDKETSLLAKLTYNGFAYEQIYGSAIVANGGKVTINGGYIEGRGGYRDEYNISGVQDWDKGGVADMVWGGDFTTDDMLENCLSNVGAKAAVQIAGEGSTVIINDGEFWGYGGANVIGINTLNGGSVKKYTLRINAGTFDTSKTDKERVPDRNAGSVNNGPWPFSASNWLLWANCRCIRDTLRGNIGIPAVDGYGENVFNTKMVHVYIDDEEPEDECIDNADLDFRYKSDSDTIIVKPREEEDYWHIDTHTWENYAGRSHYEIYAYSMGEEIGGKTLYHGPAETPTLFFSAESHYDLTDEDNPYFDRAHLAVCKWVLYEEDNSGNLITSYERVSAPFKTEHKDGHTIYNFKIPLSYFPLYSGVKWDETHKYYLVAYMEERLDSVVHSYVTKSYTTGVFQDWENGVYDGDGVLDFYYSMGLEIDYDTDYCGSFATSGAEVTYSNAAYNCDPVLTFNDAYKKLQGTKTFQWQVLEGDEWVDYGNSRISPEVAVEVLLKHEGLTGKQVRMKITSYDGIYKDALYSNVCTVQKDQNTHWPTIGVFDWEEDPANTGKYITKTASYNDAQEWLIYPYDSGRDLSTLDWSNAKAEPVFDNLEIGVYTVYARFKETVDYEAGTEIGYSKVVVGPYTAPTGTNILYNGKPVTEIIVKKGETFELTVGPVPTNATLNSTNVTTWQPDTEKSNIIQYYTGSNGLYAPFNKSISGRTIAFMADNLGYVTINAVTTLPNGTSSTEPITIRVVPDNFIPYTVSVVNRGSEVPEGSSFVPQVALHARIEMLTERRATKFEVEDLLDSEIKMQLQSDTIKKQLRDSLTWALVDPIPQLGMPPYTESTAKASINTKTGVITLKDAAQPGNVISFVGILDDPYLGRIIIPGSITVAAAPEPEVHTCDYEGYAQNDGETHFRVCTCGEKIGEVHSFTQQIVQEATYTTNAVLGMTCSCGYYYEAEVEDSMLVHSHSLEYIYDLQSHWQICTDEDCPDAYTTAHQAHNFVLQYTDDSGRECYGCTVCGTAKLDDQVSVQIVTQPKSVTAVNGATASVRVVASGDGLTYKWYYKSKGQTSFSLTTSFTGNSYNVQMNASRAERQVYCVITDAYGNSVKTDTVTLYMGNPLKITAQPQSVTAPNGATAKVTVKATGDGLTYKWYYKSKGQTSFSLTTAFKSNTYSVQMNSSRAGRQIYCVITDKYGNSVTTNTVTLNMGTALAITTQPQSVSVASGATAKVTVQAVGEGLTYKWYYKNKGASTFTLTKTFTGNTYTLEMNTSRSGRQIYCVITDKFGNSVKTDVVTLTMKVKINTQPTSVTVASGKTASVTVKATGEGLTYKWYYKNAGDTAFTYTKSFTTATYSVQMNASRAGRQVYCVVTDKYGNSVQSNVVTLGMSGVLTITTQPQSVTVASGATAKVTVKASGEGLTYQWYYKNKGDSTFTLTTSFKTNTYSVQMNASRAGRQIYCVITDQYGNTVQTVTVTLNMT